MARGLGLKDTQRLALAMYELNADPRLAAHAAGLCSVRYSDEFKNACRTGKWLGVELKAIVSWKEY